MHPLAGLAKASLVKDRECESCPIRKRLSDISIRGRKDDRHQENVGEWSTVVLNAAGPPRGGVVLVVHLIHSDPL